MRSPSGEIIVCYDARSIIKQGERKKMVRAKFIINEKKETINGDFEIKAIVVYGDSEETISISPRLLSVNSCLAY